MQHVPNLEAGRLDRARHPVIGPRAAEREQMPARLQDAQRQPPERRIVGRVVVRRIERLAHEAEHVWRVADDGVNACLGHEGERNIAIGADDSGTHRVTPGRPIARSTALAMASRAFRSVTCSRTAAVRLDTMSSAWSAVMVAL